jgi:hypothetical protein
MAKMKYTITSRRENGSPYIIYTVRFGGEAIHSQIGPISAKEAESRVAAHLAPKPAFVAKPVGYYSRAKPGPKPKGYVAPTGDHE